MTKDSANLTATTLLIATLAGIGCDPATNPEDPGEPLFVIRGTITSVGDVPITSDLRVALSWYNDLEGDAYITSQDVSVEGSFPASFILEAYSAPPEEAFVSDPEFGDYRFATAYLMAYEDNDGDGQFTLTGSEATAFHDTVRAFSDSYSSEMIFVYVESTEPVEWEEGIFFQPGLNIMTWNNTDDDREDDVILGPDDTIELTLEDDYSLKMLACENEESLFSAPFELVFDGTIPPERDETFCVDGGHSLLWLEGCDDAPRRACQPWVGCSAYLAHLTSEEPPEGWPCELLWTQD